MKRPFVGDNGEATLHIHCSGFLGNRTSTGPQGDRGSSQYSFFTQKMIMKILFIGDTTEDFASHVHC